MHLFKNKRNLKNLFKLIKITAIFFIFIFLKKKIMLFLGSIDTNQYFINENEYYFQKYIKFNYIKFIDSFANNNRNSIFDKLFKGIKNNTFLRNKLLIFQHCRFGNCLLL